MKSPKSYNPILGQLPELLSLKVTDIPHLGSDSLESIGNLYSEIVWYIGAMYRAYIAKGLFKAGYIDKESIEEIINDDNSDFSIFDFEDDYMMDPFGKIENLADIGQRFNVDKMYLFFFKRPKDEEELKIQHTFEFLLVGLYPMNKYVAYGSDIPLFFDVEEDVHFSNPDWSGADFGFKKTCETLSNIRESELYGFLNTLGVGDEKKSGRQIKITRAVILHPLRLKKINSEVINSMKKEAESMGIGLVVSIQELLANYLGIDVISLDDEWQEQIDFVMQTLENEHKFLKFRRYPALYRDAKRDIEEAEAESSMAELTRNNRINIVARIGRGTEKLLKALHLLESNEDPEGLTIDGFLTRNREKIILEFGEDVFLELKEIQRYRNQVSHSETDIQIPMLELIKVVNNAVQFLRLFRMRYIEKYTDLD